MTDDVDEFSFLPAMAQDAGIRTPLPPVARLQLPLPDGRVLSALRFGDEPPVMTLLHGAGLNAHTWDTTLLAAGLPALAVDLAGHGDSSWREGRRLRGPDPRPGRRRRDGGLDRPAAGAGRALPRRAHRREGRDIPPGSRPRTGDRRHHTRHRPVRRRAVDRGVLLGPTDWANREELVERALSFGLGGSRAAAERGVFLNSRVRADGRVEWKHHFARVANRLAAHPDEAAAAMAEQDAVRDVLAASGWDDLAGVAAPVLLIRGDRGFVTEQDAAEFVRRVPGARVETLPSTHNVQEQLPVPLGERLRTIATARHRATDTGTGA